MKATLEDHVELAIIKRCFDFEVSGVYCIGETERICADGNLVTVTRSFVFVFEWYHYQVLWTREETLGEEQPYHDWQYWGLKTPISVSDYEYLREGHERIDTQVNRMRMEDLEKKVRRQSKKDAISKRPRCRKPGCGHKMVERTASYGKYWGCLKAPKCLGKRAMTLVEK